MQSKNQIKRLNIKSNRVSDISVFLYSTLKVPSLKTLLESRLSTLNTPQLNVIQIRVSNSSDFHTNPSCLSMLFKLFNLSVLSMFFLSKPQMPPLLPLQTLATTATYLPLHTYAMAPALSPDRYFLASLSFHHGLSLSLLVSASQNQVLFLHFSSLCFSILRYGFIILFKSCKTLGLQL